MAQVSFKAGARLDKLTLGGACLLGALVRTAQTLNVGLVITSGTDGVHSGTTDNPHASGNALDVRSNDLTPDMRQRVLRMVMSDLAGVTLLLQRNPIIVVTSGGLATELFFGWLEDVGTPNEHFHFQVRKGVHVPPLPGPPEVARA